MLYIPPDRLIQALKNAGLSQKKIADLSGTSESQISRILSGDRGIGLELYLALYGLWETVVKGDKDGNE